MKKSIYNIEIEKDGYHLIYNQFKSAATVFDKEHYNKYFNGELTDEELERLTNRGFLVPDDFDEKSFYLKKRKIFLEADKTNSVIYRVFITTKCNAKCYYCYENSMEKQSMSLDTVAALIRRIKEEGKAKKKIIIEWFGGEPLVEYEKIDFITKEVLSFCEDNNIVYKSQIISNGLLFKIPEIRKKLFDWKVDRVQITLDGLKERHENIKNFTEKNAFETIIDNVDYLINNGIFVNLRINFEEKNADEVIALVKFLSIRFKHKKNLNVYPYLIFKDNDCIQEKTNPESFKKIICALYENGFFENFFLTMGMRIGCQANRCNGGSILPDGTLYRCPLATNNKEDSLGNIFNSIQSTNNIWLNEELDKVCVDCKFLPMCGGGCIYAKLKGKSFCVVQENQVISELEMALDMFIKNNDRRL